MTWEIFKKVFVNGFYHREMREDKVEEFINLRQGGMSVLYYSLKFTKLSKYAPSVVSNPRDEMSHFLTGVSNDLVEECNSTIIDDNINVSRLIVYAQQVEITRFRRKSREAKKAKSYEGSSSKGRLDIQEKPRFKKRFYSQVPTKFPKARDDKVSKPKSQKRRLLAHQKRRQLVESVARNIMVIALLEGKLVWVWKECPHGQRLPKFEGERQNKWTSSS